MEYEIEVMDDDAVGFINLPWYSRNVRVDEAEFIEEMYS